MFITDKEPDFINSEGVKWWKDHDTTNYATKEDIYGRILNATVYIVEMPSGYRTRLLIDQRQNIIADEQSLEAMAIKIDLLKFRDAAMQESGHE